MEIWQIILIVVLSILIGIPFYIWIGVKPGKYFFAIVSGCFVFCFAGGNFKTEYDMVVIEKNPMWVKLFWPAFFIIATILLAFCPIGLIWRFWWGLIKKLLKK